ncbi:hypothetical protein [Nocardia gipuzkoensis]|uniref:hypothetical protein n=1 Tax=Nocardia gipuzkoensis TaxID=2749991 RepID=UPI00237E713D|nr:hypothetical protein [Nocardia gipuzkoensis]MDE1675014.1 hypothetical protein [Nocardia gipuzkoensis]
MTWLRDLITIPTSVGQSDFVVGAAEGADLDSYVVTAQLRKSFSKALQTVEHAVTTGRSQGQFLHGSFGSGKSHFMAVLREILSRNPVLRGYPARPGSVSDLAETVSAADSWLGDRKVLTLTLHMLEADSVEQKILDEYLKYATENHPDVPIPSVHRADDLIKDAARLREAFGDEQFFARLGSGGGTSDNLTALMNRAEGWTEARYEAAVASPPGSKAHGDVIRALTTAFFAGAVRSYEYVDLDEGLQVITRHASEHLGVDVLVLFLDEFFLWLATGISDHLFVNTEGAKLNKLLESSDAARPIPIVSFVSRQRYLEEFLGPQVGGTEREALAHVMRSVQGRFGEIQLEDTNLPEIVEKRLLRPGTEVVADDEASRAIDIAFASVRDRRDVWDVLLSGAQYGDAGVGSDRATFRRLYPFSPALVATLVALSQAALQRERTAIRVMTELLVDDRDTLQVNDLIGVAALFDKLVLNGELPDRPVLKQQFRTARDTYKQKLRPLLLAMNGITEQQTANHEQFALDDKLVKTLLLDALVPEVPALHNLTATRLHALNFGSITAPVPGYEGHIIVERLTRLANDAGELQVGEGPDPVFSLKLSTVDYDRLLDLVPHNETATGVLQGLVREMVCAELGLAGADGTFGELPYAREWRGRRHHMNVRFGRVRDRDTMPDAMLYADGEAWRLIIDYPFDAHGDRRDDFARVETLQRGSRTLFWLPYFLTDEQMTRIAQLAKINYLLGSGGYGDRLAALAADWSVSDRQQGKLYLQQRQHHLRSTLGESLRQAYGLTKPRESDVVADDLPVLTTLMDGLPLADPHGGTLKAAFDNLTGELLNWSYPGTPHLPDDEKPPTKADLAKVLRYAGLASADVTQGIAVADGDRKTVARICNPLRLGELVEHRYVLTKTTCWWSSHLRQEAAKLEYHEHFPVHVLRTLLERPARGFDRDLQNLILAVFALEQQLAWYQGENKIEIQAVQQITDQLILKSPPMPDPQVWDRAVPRAKALFGEPLSEVCIPASLSEFGIVVREKASEFVAAAEELVQELTAHAGVLGLESGTTAGRLSTAGYVARLLRELSSETDDVVIVGMIADADLGAATEIAASKAFIQAEHVITALASVRWQLLESMVQRAEYDERAKVIIEELRITAAHDQISEDLAPALKKAENAAANLLIEETPAPRHPPTAPTGNSAAESADTAAAGASVSVGASTTADTATSTDAAKPVPLQRIPSSQTSSATHTRDISDLAGAQAVFADVEREIVAGHRVRINWEVLE